MEELVQEIVPAQAPIHAAALCREVARHLGYKRTGSRIQAAVLDIAHRLYAHSTEDVGLFFWADGQSPDTWSGFRSPDPDTPCKVDEIAMPELVNLARSIVPREDGDPITDMARALGLRRLKGATRPRLEKAWAMR